MSLTTQQLAAVTAYLDAQFAEYRGLPMITHGTVATAKAAVGLMSNAGAVDVGSGLRFDSSEMEALVRQGLIGSQVQAMAAFDEATLDMTSLAWGLIAEDASGHDAYTYPPGARLGLALGWLSSLSIVGQGTVARDGVQIAAQDTAKRPVKTLALSGGGDSGIDATQVSVYGDSRLSPSSPAPRPLGMVWLNMTTVAALVATGWGA